MTVTRRRFAAGALAAGTLAAAPRAADAVIILDSTWRAEGGFRAHLALADQPQFASVIALSSDDGQVWGSGSGTWLGNRQGRARILTAAHVFNRDGAADDYVYRAPDGEVMQGTDIVFHPLYNWSNAERTGYDFAVVRLDGPIDDAGPPPALYGGNREDGARIVMVGWGSRGIGSVGQKPNVLHDPRQGRRHQQDRRGHGRPAPAAQERRCRQLAGRHAAPRERGRRTARRHFRLGRQRRLGLDQDGGGGWAICGVNANGNGDTYGAQSWFARVSGVRDWLNATMPGLRFVS